MSVQHTDVAECEWHPQMFFTCHGRTVCVCLHERTGHRANWLSKCSSALHQHITIFICSAQVGHIALQPPTYILCYWSSGIWISFLTAGKGFYVSCWEMSWKKLNFGDTKARKWQESEYWRNDLSSEEVCSLYCSLSHHIWTTYASIFTHQNHLLQH